MLTFVGLLTLVGIVSCGKRAIVGVFVAVVLGSSGCLSGHLKLANLSLREAPIVGRAALLLRLWLRWLWGLNERIWVIAVRA